MARESAAHDERPISFPPTTHSDVARNHPPMREIVMQRHHRDRDMLWVTSGLPFLTWATAAQAEPRRTGRREIAGSDRLGSICPNRLSLGDRMRAAGVGEGGRGR
jgi:hypothetical protein